MNGVYLWKNLRNGRGLTCNEDGTPFTAEQMGPYRDCERREERRRRRDEELRQERQEQELEEALEHARSFIRTQVRQVVAQQEREVQAAIASARLAARIAAVQGYEPDPRDTFRFRNDEELAAYATRGVDPIRLKAVVAAAVCCPSCVARVPGLTLCHPEMSVCECRAAGRLCDRCGPDCVHSASAVAAAMTAAMTSESRKRKRESSGSDTDSDTA